MIESTLLPPVTRFAPASPTGVHESAAFTRCTVELSPPVILAACRTEWPARNNRTMSRCFRMNSWRGSLLPHGRPTACRGGAHRLSRRGFEHEVSQALREPSPQAMRA